MGPPSTDDIPSSTQIIDVSRTVQSSDLFTPYREPRVTLPTIRKFKQNALPFGGKFWGGSLTEYGGIGDLSFIGRQRVRDLEVTRGHRHYRSGFSKYLTDVQPYRLTELHLSECRLNDQILPAPLKTDISKLNWQQTYPWPDSQAYGTHRSIFEVFPSVKVQPLQSDQNALGGSRNLNAQLQGLRKTTRKALLDLNKRQYQTTLYLDSYRQNLGLPPAKSPVTEDERGSTDAEKINDAGKECINRENEEGKNETTGEEVEEGEKGTREDAPNQAPSNLNLLETNSFTQLIFDDTAQITEEANKPKAGVGPCWPPGDSYVIDNIKGSQLVERTDITQPLHVYYEVKRPTEDKKPRRLLSTRTRLEKQLHEVLVRGHKREGAPLSVITWKSQDAFLKERMAESHIAEKLHASDQTQDDSTSAGGVHGIAPCHRKTDFGRKACVERPEKPALHSIDPSPFVPLSSDKAPLLLPPAPLADCLPTAGSRIPHKLGLRYKSEAHKRYQLTYPEKMPDLRTNRKEGKKYFFYSFHSSAFRG
ncbi:uncharacterized protein LOC110990468 [Acanthaster planci]|uniref:Uncharacterized protein LOC110990468 n=1 Tax=Acanthaster planci TaxID=133434 RepID=A0A8B8A1D7_ACAPL|nr:uncharacterized protein LOC110990468 [Acanthaster planci]